MADSTLLRKKLALFHALARQQDLGDAGPPLADPQRRQYPAPLSFAQEGLWLLHQLNPGDPAYNEHFAVRLTGQLKEPALEKGLNYVVRRHEVLRSHFQEIDGTVQTSISDVFVALKIEDLRQTHEASRLCLAMEKATAEARLPFDLTRGPLLRAKIYRIHDDESLLLLVIHHIAIDGWSFGILLQEVAAAYEAYSSGVPLLLPDLPAQYSDFARWQRKHHDDVREKTELDYWIKQLGDASPTDLTTQPSTAPGADSAGRQTVAIDPALIVQTRSVAQKFGVTVFMVWLAAFFSVLSRYTGQDDIVTGTVASVRPNAVFEKLIGIFLNTLALRLRVDSNSSFHELLTKVHDTCIDAFAHQNVPFERVVQAVNPGHNRGGNPLFQTIFVFQEVPQLSFAGLSAALVDIHNGCAKFDLSVSVRQAGDISGLCLEYRKAAFDDGTIKGMAQHLLTLLGGALQVVERRISDLPFLSQGEREQVLVEWNRTEAEYPPKCVHELFEEQARSTPEAIAVEYEGQAWSYRELNERANQLAHYLRELRVGPEVLVGLCVERSLEMMAGIIGILKAGGAYVPLSPEYPIHRLAFMVEDLRIPVLLSQSHLLSRLPAGNSRTLCLDSQWPQLAECSRGNPLIAVSERNIAYVMHTSGSTGGPKGVAVEHRSIVRLVKNANFLRPRVEDVFLQLAPISFDASTLEIWACLLNGGKLVVHPPQVPSLEELGEAIERSGVTIMWLTAGLFHQMVEGPVEKLRGLRQLLAGGDVLSGAHIKRALAALPNTRIINGYGPTENTTFTCCYSMDDSTLGSLEESVPIGGPISNTQVYVLDKEGEPVPVGVRGELYIGGTGLARGYLRRPELTAEKFVPNRFSDRVGDRLYRSGDLVKWSGDGTLEFLGRTDRQVKVRGFRIELQEIEMILLEHSSVQEAAVVVRQTADRDKQLVAYIVGNHHVEGTRIPELKEYLRGRLPEYMVPSAFVMLEALPLTLNGKVDRKVLSESDLENSVGGEEQIGPRTPDEEILSGIFATVLKLERIGINQGFFEAGGHSLLATQVISRVRSAFGIEVPLAALFAAPTVTGLAERIRNLRRRSEGTAPDMVRVPREGDMPLSFAQQRLWFLNQLEPANVTYNIGIGLRLSGELNREALRKSLNEIVRRHEVLRTYFGVQNGSPCQVITAKLEVQISVIDLQSLEAEERAAYAERLGREEVNTPFMLAHGPLLRVKLLQLEEQLHVLLICMHHIVSDGWSLGIMAKEIGQLYGTYVQGAESSLPELNIQYADFAVWQRKWLQNEVLAEQLRYWRKQLVGMEPLELPTDHVRPVAMSQWGATTAFSLTEGLSRKLKELSRREEVTLFMSLLAAFQVVLSKYTGQQDIVVGTVVANPMVLRTELSGNPSFVEVLRRVRQVTLDAYQNQDVPFEKLVEELQPERDLSRSPFFQVMLVLQNNDQQELQMQGVQVDAFALESGVAKFDLVLNLRENAEGITGGLNYALDVYEAETVKQVAERFRMVLEQMVAEPEQRIGDLSLLTEAEREQVFVEWNQTEAKYPQRCVHELFEERVTRQPEAVAVEYEGRQLSYAELNRRANQFAGYLAKHGVGTEVRVGICIERSIEMIVALLGALKAGGAYVPLDPEYPTSRLAFMLEDAEVEVLVIQAEIWEKSELRFSGKVICWEREWEAVEQEKGENLGIEVDMQNLAYVIYTSGSTGKPKGVMVSHHSFSSHLQWRQQTYPLTALDKFLHKTSLSFDIAGWEIFAPLLAGAQLLIAIPGGQRDLGYLIEEIVNHEVSVVHFNPTLLRAFLEESNARSCHHLKDVFCGGEVMSPDLQDSFANMLPARLHNQYGPTETTVDVLLFDCGCEPKRRRIPLGRPIANTQVYVLDEKGEPVPVGIGGELYIGGAGLARGYLKRPELTAEKFVPNRFSGRGDRLYRSGDLVKWSRDGNLEFLGRIDQQVKLRGYRIELGEIETALREQHGVRDAVVMVSEEANEQRLVAYVVVEDSEEGAMEVERGQRWERWSAGLRQKLPQYMLPTEWVELKEIPLTPTGKVDRKALPRPETSQRRAGLEYIAPRTPIEQALVAIWADVLKIDHPGIRDNFFELGGHSLLATQLISRVQKFFHVSLPLRQLFEQPTIENMSQYIANAAPENEAPDLAAVSREAYSVQL
jgi:amino acid adenylation domain-containing protein